MECKKLVEIIHQLFLLSQHHRTFLAQKSFFCLHLMIESFFIQKIQYRTGATGFRVHGTDVNFWNPRLHDRPCAHRARFQRHVQLTFFQAPVAHTLARFFDCRDLRMCQRAMIDHPAVVTPADDFVLIHDHAADRHFSERPGFLRLADRRFHIFLFPCQFCCHCFSSFLFYLSVHPTQKDRTLSRVPQEDRLIYVKFKSVYQYPNRLSRGGWRVERTKRSKPNIAAIYFSLFP